MDKTVEELQREIKIKRSKALLLQQEADFLERIVESMKRGETYEEIKARLERNPFEDFNIF